MRTQSARSQTPRTQAVAFALAILGSVSFAGGAFADTLGEPGRSAGGRNPLKNVYFGEQHLHTENSFDAFTVGVTMSWDDAYNFAKGEEVELSTTGEPMQRRTPYDFVAITDHAEYFGVLKELTNPDSPLSQSDFARQLAASRSDPESAKAAVTKLIGSLVSNTPLPEYVTSDLRVNFWNRYLETADRHNDPGTFTALYAFEWTSIPNGSNMHRNVFFKDRAAAVPFSAFDSIYPEDLWTYLETQRNQGIDVFAIPHNSNVSNGWLFSENKFLGGPLDERYARRQALNEPLFEMAQTKGQSEAHPIFSPNDEFAGFEQFSNLISLGVPAPITMGAFYRTGLAVGIKLEDTLGHNPYKMGVVAGADVHSGYSGSEEWNWHGAHGTQDDTPEKRLDPTPNAAGEPGYVVSSAGITAVWAGENTREGIFEGMQSKETYGTSGTMIRLRFFGGWSLPGGITQDREFVQKAYEAGVPMGQDLPAQNDLNQKPSFAIWSLKDPNSGNLDRIQIVKVWSDPSNGYSKEAIYDVAWGDADRRQPDPNTGKLPSVGNTVNIAEATYTNDIGDTELVAEWTDPDFDPTVASAYYVRVLEIPTPRWSTFDAKELGVDPPEEVSPTIQERAWSSPIWYTPSPEIERQAEAQGLQPPAQRHASPSQQ